MYSMYVYAVRMYCNNDYQRTNITNAKIKNLPNKVSIDTFKLSPFFWKFQVPVTKFKLK